jgi:[ribosomal protein S5]-alanine N-acetyltransferase
VRSSQVQLVEVQQTHKLALRRGPAHLQQMLNVSIPDGWPEFPVAFEVCDDEGPRHDRWPSYFFICPLARSLVGNGGFSGSVNSFGEIAIGYEIAPQFRNRGFATAAVIEILWYAFSRSEVAAVVAHTLPEQNASNTVLQKVGMSFFGELPDKKHGSVWCWRIAKPA